MNFTISFNDIGGTFEVGSNLYNQNWKDMGVEVGVQSEVRWFK